MEITYYGHSCFEVKAGNKVLLFDPFITPNAMASKVKTESLQPDYILVSHGHEDHIYDVADIAKRTKATVISNFEIINWLSKKGVHNTHSMNIGGHWFFDFGKVKCVNAVHSSSLPDGSYGGNPMGYLLETSEGNFYYAGDTALTYDMKLMGDYKHIDFAFLPLGNNYTMGIDNAIIASDFIRCENIIGMHYDTFDPIKIDHEEAKEKFSRAGKNLFLMKVGEKINMKQHA